MNAERLHAIAILVRDDLAQTEAPDLLSQLAAALRAAVDEPTDATNQEEMGSLRVRLRDVLVGSRTNEFSDAQRMLLEELGIVDLLGANLLERLESIFARNEITVAIAATEIAEIDVRLKALVVTLDQLIAGLAGAGIGADELAQGEFEVGFLIPRVAVGNELERLGQEFEKLDSILGPFVELSGVNRPDLQVRTIASSEFQVFLLALPGLALTMSKVVESLLSSYEKIRNIRAQVGTLQDEDDVPPEAIEGLVQHANDRIGIDIDALTEQLIAEAADRLPDGREFELKVEVKRSLRRLAKRIDEGYSIEVRAFTPPEIEEGTEDDPAPVDPVVEVAKSITARQPRMRTMNLTGRPILELPEGDDEDPDDPDPDADIAP